MENELDYLTERHENLHGFMGAKPQPGDADRLPHFIQHNGADWCVKMAANYARIDLLRPLVEEYGGDIRQEGTLLSDRHRGDRVRNNLINEVLLHHLASPSADKSPEGRERVTQTVEYLLEKGLSAALNKDGLENAVCYAYQLAHPEHTFNPKHPAYDWVLDSMGDKHESFAEPLALIAQHQPEAIASFEKSLEIESRRLRREFSKEAAEQKSGGEGTLERVWGKITKALGFDHS